MRGAAFLAAYSNVAYKRTGSPVGQQNKLISAKSTNAAGSEGAPRRYGADVRGGNFGATSGALVRGKV